MRGTRNSKAKEAVKEVTPPRWTPKKTQEYAGTIRMRTVRPVVPTDAAEKEMLMRDLAKMKVSRLAELPWSLQSEEMLRELLGKPVPVSLSKTRRGKPFSGCTMFNGVKVGFKLNALYIQQTKI